MTVPVLQTKQTKVTETERRTRNEYEATSGLRRTSFVISPHVRLPHKCQRRRSTVNVHFGAQRGLGGLDQGLSVLHVHEDTIADLVQVLDGNAGSLLVAVGDPDRVNAAVQQLLGLLQQGAGQDCGQDSVRPVRKTPKLLGSILISC